jgi:dTDP-4-dehydrorhamnose 3,5-epimerase
MPIQVEETAIPDVKIIRATRFNDERGFFTETYKEAEYLEAGIPRFVQDNLSESSKGIIRGLHWQTSPFAQGKLVSCLSGSILDVAVDIRTESATFGQHVSVELNSNEQISLWIPEGFAHGFQAQENSTRVHYKVTNYWSKDSEQGLNPLDPVIGIRWPIVQYLLSEKDRTAQNWADLISR